MTYTHVILDGLDDPALGQQLSARWASAGFDNAVDVAGRSARLALAGGDADSAMTEVDADRAAAIARAFGVAVRDRTGKAFEPANDLADLRDHVAREYKARLATALMFGLPAVVLHYAGPALAGGGGAARAMALPWLIEMLLVGWVCLAAGWPMLWQGGLALVHLRATSDLLTGVVVLAAFVPSAVGVLSLLFTVEPWFGAPGLATGPAFHAAALAVTLAAAQRWLVYRNIQRLSGRAAWMPRGYSRFVSVWLAAAAIVCLLIGWRAALAWVLLVPNVLALGAVNPWTPGWSMVLPVVGFGLCTVIGPGALGIDVQGVRVEIAAGFSLLMTAAFAWGWRRLPARDGSD